MAFAKKPSVSKSKKGISFWLGINLLVCLLSFLSYVSCLVKPSTFAVAGLFTFTVPVFLLTNVFFLVYWLFKKPIISVFSFVTLLFGWKFIVGLVGFNFSPDPEGGDFKVLNYNVNTFKGFGSKADLTGESARKMINWLLHSDADIMCIQEFYHVPDNKDFNALKKLKKAGFKHHFFSRALRTGWDKSIGMITLSKFPIVYSEVIRKAEKSNNQILLTDVKTPVGVVRIINIHLQSNYLKEEEVTQSQQGENVSNNLKSIWRKLTRGFTRRIVQSELLIQTIEASPYPVIVAGDLNETPFSYTYRQIDEKLNNSFEEAGTGFGFSYNGFIPFLRIDGQFADERFEVPYFQTHNHVRYSDHFPISAAYKLKKE